MVVSPWKWTIIIVLVSPWKWTIIIVLVSPWKWTIIIVLVSPWKWTIISNMPTMSSNSVTLKIHFDAKYIMDATYNGKPAPYLDLHITIDSERWLKTKMFTTKEMLLIFLLRTFHFQ
jgi:hypothetical protein